MPATPQAAMRTRGALDPAGPLVSIVTPSYNQARYIGKTIQSVLGQTYPHIEYIVMDGGSTDSTVDILRSFGDRIAYWQSAKDAGFADAIASGFLRSKGSILAWLNSDDLLAPDAVEKAVGCFRRHPETGMVYGNRICIDEDDTVLYWKASVPAIGHTPLMAYLLFQETCFWSREAYEVSGGVDRAMRFAIDYDLFCRISKRYPLRRAPGIWGYFRKHTESKTMSQYRTLGKQETWAVQERYWGKRVSRPWWIAGLFACRIYGFLGALVTPRAQWPGLSAPRKSAVWKGLKTLAFFG
jgi:glycosyltransferase involved in cell wall biosynthesis